MATFTSNSPDETAAFAENLAQRAQPGVVLGLVGDLGAGKTQFVKGFAKGLGVTEPVLSPTFALMHCYTSGRLPLFHLDFYRLERQDQIIAAGLEECFTATGVAIVEWWDRWQAAEPPGLWRLHFETLAENERRISYDAPGA